MARASKASAPGMVGISDQAWQAREDLHTLTRAAEISKDGGRLKAARAEAKKQMVSLMRVASPRKKVSRAEKLKDVEL